MADESDKVRGADEATDIKETDIVFDCPHCGKSLAIDYRGAGLSIPCSDCGESCVVPIPEGMQIDDIDSTEEEQEIRILHLRKSLRMAQDRVGELESEIDELKARRQTLEAARANNFQRFGLIMEKIGVIQSSLNDMTSAITRITEYLASELSGESGQGEEAEKDSDRDGDA